MLICHASITLSISRFVLSILINSSCDRSCLLHNVTYIHPVTISCLLLIYDSTEEVKSRVYIIICIIQSHTISKACHRAAQVCFRTVSDFDSTVLYCDDRIQERLSRCSSLL